MTFLLKILLFFILLFPFLSKAQSGIWTWMAGTRLHYSGVVYGMQGVPNANNTPPGTDRAASWTDLDGNLWLFGGNTYNGVYADLWKYNVVLNMWTWIKGPGIVNPQPVYG